MWTVVSHLEHTDPIRFDIDSSLTLVKTHTFGFLMLTDIVFQYLN